MAEIYRYSIIRFRPIAETGEFANIGVIVLDVHSGLIDYQLAPKRFARVKSFFDLSNYGAYASCIEALRIELPRLAEFLILARGHSSHTVFDETIRQRESSVVYSTGGVVKSSDDIATVTAKLFARYVKRDLVPMDTAENTFTKNIRRSLRDHGLRNFRQLRIDDDVVPISFPLASIDREFRAIKPLTFTQRNPLSVFDLGTQWHRRFVYLLENGKLQPGSVLIAVESPLADDDDRTHDAFRLAREQLLTLPFQLEESGPGFEDNVLNFATAFSHTTELGLFDRG